MIKQWLLPAPGRRVRDPITMAVLPNEGAEKPINSYWIRRIDAGDVLVRPEPQEPERQDFVLEAIQEQNFIDADEEQNDGED